MSFAHKGVPWVRQWTFYVATERKVEFFFLNFTVLLEKSTSV